METPKLQNLFQNQRNEEESAMKARSRHIVIGRTQAIREVKKLLTEYKEKGIDPTHDIDQFIKFVKKELSGSEIKSVELKKSKS